MLRFQLVEQTHRRLRVDAVGTIRHCFQRVDIDRTMNIHPLATAIRLQLLLDATTNPTKGRDAVELRMATVAEIHRIVFTLVFTEFFVCRDELRLFRRIKFAEHVLGLLVNKTESMQQFLDAGRRIFHAVSCFDVMPG